LYNKAMTAANLGSSTQQPAALVAALDQNGRR
jgi:hypothetical protein